MTTVTPVQYVVLLAFAVAGGKILATLAQKAGDELVGLVRMLWLRHQLPSLLRKAELERQLARNELISRLEEGCDHCGEPAPEPDCKAEHIAEFDHVTKVSLQAMKIHLEMRAGIRHPPNGSPIGFELLKK